VGSASEGFSTIELAAKGDDSAMKVEFEVKL
jgi:hypothetical protein